MAKKVTMQQIADHLGVSKFSVSKALSGKEGVSSDTRERIYEAANQLGYFSQNSGKALARAFADKPSQGIIVVLFPDLHYQTNESPYWAPIVDGMTQELYDNGLDMVAITDYRSDHMLKVINPGSMDGVISVGPVSRTLLETIGGWGIPLVTIDNDVAAEAADKLFINNFDAVRQLTDQLIGMGHRSFQYVGDIHYARSFYDRWLGFRSSLEEHGIPYNPERGLLQLSEASFDVPDEIREQISSLIDTGELPSVLVCACDKIAIMAIAALEQLGLKVPADCSVTGFDNIEESLSCQPKLTTIHVPKQWLGIRSVQMLLWRKQFRGTPPEKVLLPAEIIVRESTSIPSKKQTDTR